MAKERRDSKNRLLRKGEYQKEDGRYMYRYTDAFGKVRFVYSWTLTKTDRAPKGVAPTPCLRDLEVQIAKDISDQIDSATANKQSLNEYFEKYFSEKRALKENTRSLYRRTYDLYLRDRIGNKKISSFRYSDIKKCYNDILEEHDISIASMNTINTVLKPIFKMAVRDNLIRANPVEGVLAELSKEIDSTKSTREALSSQQQEALLAFINSSRVYSKWKNFFVVMLGTGCRVGEMCGLTWDDCDFTNNVINIRHTLYYTQDEFTGKYSLRAHSPKSSAGYRSIPMFKDVREALKEERIRQMKDGFCVDTIDGVSGFVFCNSRGKARIPDNVNDTLHKLISRHNTIETSLAKDNGRTPILIPDISSHVLRHTFCTRMCEINMDLKVLQEVMGHSKVTTTMDVYASVTADHKASTFKRVDEAIRAVQSY